jgi:hypothetical protein
MQLTQNKNKEAWIDFRKQTQDWKESSVTGSCHAPMHGYSTSSSWLTTSCKSDWLNLFIYSFMTCKNILVTFSWKEKKLQSR